MTSKQKTSSLKSTLFKWSAIILLIGFVSYPLTQVLVVFFGKVDPKLRAKVFMSYRNKFADALMINGRYKSIKPNQYPKDKEREKFNKIAQDKDRGVLTKFNYPEHYAREPEWNFTLCDKVYYLLWKIRYNVCSYLTVHDLQEAKKEKKEPASDKTNKFFKQIPEMTSTDYKDLFKNVDENGKGWVAALPTFCEIMTNLIEKPEVYKFKGDEISKALEKDICTFMDKLGYSKDEVEKHKRLIPDFFIKHGEAYPNVWYSTIYSRLYYYLIFINVNTKFDFGDLKNKQLKPEDYNKQTMKILADMFAQLFSRVYEEDYKYELKEPSFIDRMTKWFGPIQDVSGVKDQSKNIDILKEALNNNRALLA